MDARYQSYPCVRTKRRSPSPHLHAWGRDERPPLQGGGRALRGGGSPAPVPSHRSRGTATCWWPAPRAWISPPSPPYPSVVTSPRYSFVLRRVLRRMRSCRQETVDQTEHISIETCFIGGIRLHTHTVSLHRCRLHFRVSTPGFLWDAFVCFRPGRAPKAIIESYFNPISRTAPPTSFVLLHWFCLQKNQNLT